MVTKERIETVFEGCDLHFVDCPNVDSSYKYSDGNHIAAYRNNEKNLVLFSSFESLIEFLESESDLNSYIDTVKAKFSEIERLQEDGEYQKAGDLFGNIPAIFVDYGWERSNWNSGIDEEGKATPLTITHPSLSFNCNHDELGSLGFIDNRVPTDYSGKEDSPSGPEWKLRPEFDEYDGTKGQLVRPYWYWMHDWNDCFQEVVSAEKLLSTISEYLQWKEEEPEAWKEAHPFIN